MKHFTEQEIRNAFIIGLLSTRDGFNGECLFDHCAPDDIYCRGSSDEVDLFDAFKNKAVNRLADKYIQEVCK